MTLTVSPALAALALYVDDDFADWLSRLGPNTALHLAKQRYLTRNDVAELDAAHGFQFVVGELRAADQAYLLSDIVRPLVDHLVRVVPPIDDLQLFSVAAAIESHLDAAAETLVTYWAQPFTFDEAEYRKTLTATTDAAELKKLVAAERTAVNDKCRAAVDARVASLRVPFRDSWLAPYFGLVSRTLEPVNYTIAEVLLLRASRSERLALTLLSSTLFASLITIDAVNKMLAQRHDDNLRRVINVELPPRAVELRLLQCALDDDETPVAITIADHTRVVARDLKPPTYARHHVACTITDAARAELHRVVKTKSPTVATLVQSSTKDRHLVDDILCAARDPLDSVTARRVIKYIKVV